MEAPSNFDPPVPLGTPPTTNPTTATEPLVDASEVQQPTQPPVEIPTAVTPPVNAGGAAPVVPMSLNTVSSDIPNQIPAPKPRKSKRFALVVVFIILVAGGSALAWYETPQHVLQRLLAYGVRGIDRFSYTSQTVVAIDTTKLGANAESVAAMVGETAGTSPADLGGTLTLNGEVDAKDQANVRTHTVLGITSGKTKIDAEFITIGDIVYIDITSLPDLGFVDATPFMNKWIKIDPALIAKEQNQDETYQKYKTDSQLSDLQKQQLIKLLQQSNILNVIQKFPITRVDSKFVHHYQLAINPDGLLAFLEAASPIVTKQELPADSIESYRTSFASFNTTHIEAWLDWFGSQPRKAVITSPIQEGSNPPIGSITSTIHLENIGKKPTIEAPTTSVLIEDVIKEFTAKQSANNQASEPPPTVVQ